MRHGVALQILGFKWPLEILCQSREERLAKEKLIKKGQEDFAESESDWVFVSLASLVSDEADVEIESEVEMTSDFILKNGYLKLDACLFSESEIASLLTQRDKLCMLLDKKYSDNASFLLQFLSHESFEIIVKKHSNISSKENLFKYLSQIAVSDFLMIFRSPTKINGDGVSYPVHERNQVIIDTGTFLFNKEKECKNKDFLIIKEFDALIGSINAVESLYEKINHIEKTVDKESAKMFLPAYTGYISEVFKKKTENFSIATGEVLNEIQKIPKNNERLRKSIAL